MTNLGGANLEFVREDDFVEYFLFPQLPDNLQSLGAEPAGQELECLRVHLAALLSQCKDVVDGLVKEQHYLWHKDVFNLHIRTGSADERLLNDEQRADAAPLPPHLYGVSHYGDNILDEWFIVYLLCQLTRQMPELIARVVDADGEFLLIEAADVLPKWANPETCEQRVYISGGSLQLVQNSPSNTSQLLQVAHAVEKIRANPTLYTASKEIQESIKQRLKEFNGKKTHLHRQIVNLPLGVAALLRERPALIASAVRAFCDRDQLDMKACRTMRFFPPEQRVRTNVRFTRCLYAMIMHNQYTPDRKIGWNLDSPKDSERYKEDLLGIKIASGFEILATQAKTLEDEGNEPAWRAYLRSLNQKGYFRGNLEGSEEYKRLYNEARIYFKGSKESFRTVPLVGREILDLLQSIEINGEDLRDEENNLRPSDSDDWLNICAANLDTMLEERYGPKKMFGLNGDINAEEFTKNFSEFLSKQSALEGIEHDSDMLSDDSDEDEMEGEAKEEQDAEDQAEGTSGRVKKNASMRKACKTNPLIGSSERAEKKSASLLLVEDEGTRTQVRNLCDFVVPEDTWDSNSEMSDYEDEDDLERNIEAMTNPGMNIDMDFEDYMSQMDKELAQTSIGQSFATAGKQEGGKKGQSGTTEDDFDDIESFEPININVNTLKNMMDSYKSQMGSTGPVSHLLNAMGAGMSTAAPEDADKDMPESTV